jgi:signal transduction histidine kinase/ligand-binding sensor domain-containing protein
MYWITMVLVAVLSAVNLMAEEPSWQNRVWRVDSGLMDNRVVGVRQSSDGFLWVATVTGVMRFDGLEFRSLPVSLDLFPGGKIFAFFIDSRDRFWIIKHSGEVLCVDHGKVVMRFSLRIKPVQSELVPSIVEEKSGRLFFCFPDGTLFQLFDGKIEPLILDDCYGQNPARQVVKDGLGQIWLSLGDQGFGMITEGKFCLQEELPVSCMVGAHSGGVWVFSGKELWRYSAADHLEGVTSLPDELADANQNAFYEDTHGVLWIGSKDSGLFHFDGDSFSVVSSGFLNIMSVDEDKDGNLWIGTWDGLGQSVPAVLNFLKSGNNRNIQNVFSISEDKDGYYWIVWSNGGISRSPSTDLLKSGPLLTWPLLDPKVVPGAQCAVAAPAGGVWVGTEFSGVYWWKDGVVETNLGKEYGFGVNEINALHMSPDGHLWIGSENPGLNHSFLRRWHQGKMQVYPLSVESNVISAIVTDSKGNTWCATYGGYLYKIGTDGVIANEPVTQSAGICPILSLCPGPDESLWIGFSGLGLGRLKNGRFSCYSTEQGLNENLISRILCDGTNRLWLAGNRGLSSVSQKDFDDVDAGIALQVQSVVYGKNEGLANSRPTGYFWPGALCDKSGRLLFGMTGGIAVISPNKGDRQSPPAVIIDQVSVDGRLIAANGALEMFPKADQAKIFELHQAGQTHLRIPPGAHHLEISYTALSFRMPESNRYRCRLVELSQDWNDVGTLRKISYYGVSPGEYQFKVVARNSDGSWSSEAASIFLTIEAYWWETTWFRIGAPLLVLGILLSGVFIFLRRRHQLQIERMKVQETMEKERARIAADLHDEMGSNLAQIALLCEKALEDSAPTQSSRVYLDKALENSHVLSSQLDAVVWAVDPANDTLEKTVDYLVDYTQEFLDLAGIRLRLEVAEDLPPVMLSSSCRHQLFLSVKEALHNVEKHACATSVTLRIKLGAGTLVVEVEDNGKGLDNGANVAVGADGLGNMAHRMQLLQGLFEIGPGKEGHGTLVRFVMPLQ